MEKDVKIRLVGGRFIFHQDDVVVAEVLLQIDVLPGFESIFEHFNLAGLIEGGDSDEA